MFLKNCWYVAGWSSELAPGQCLGRKFLGQSIVLYRTETGGIAAVEDRCCHRGAPLSIGQVNGEFIRCPYHGMEFDRHGACVRIPTQDRIPAAAKVRAYPIEEKNGILWIWMGDVNHADRERIFDHPYHDDAKWAWRCAHFHINGNWQLLIDNLLDLTHLPYIHPHTVGGNPDTHFRAEMTTNRTAKGVKVERRMPASEPPPTYKAVKAFKGLVDRWQEIEFEPSLLRIHTGACDVGTGAYEGMRDHGFSMIGLHGITPETENTTHYFWSMATNVLDEGIPDLVFEQTALTFKEDQAVLELQQQRIDEVSGWTPVSIMADAGGAQARRVIAGLIEAEQ